jgi:hypothetical protein
VSELEDLYAIIDRLESDERVALFRYLRKYIEIHPMEGQLMASAETILDALARSSDLTIRGIKGVIAEASFAAEVIPKLLDGRRFPRRAMYTTFCCRMPGVACRSR